MKMYIYIVCSVPDYIGIDIEKAFVRESEANEFCDAHNKNAPRYDQWFVDKVEVF